MNGNHIFMHGLVGHDFLFVLSPEVSCGIRRYRLVVAQLPVSIHFGSFPPR